MSKPNEEIEVKDQRRKSFYIADNRMIDEAAPLIGVYGGAVYSSLLRHADKERKTWPSVNKIAKEWGISRTLVMRSIQKLEALNMIAVSRDQGNHNEYRLLDPAEWRLTTGPCDTPVQEDTGLPHTPVEEETGLRDTPVEGVTSPPHTPVPVHHVDPKYTQSNKTKSISRESDDFQTEGNYKTKPPKKPKIGPQVNYLEEINKQLVMYDQETQLAIKLFLDGIAQKNKSGDMTQGRYLNLLCEIRTVSTTTSKDVFKEALSKATKAGAGNINYVRVVIKSLTEKANNDKKRNTDHQGTNLFESKKHNVVYSLGKNGDWYKNNKLISRDQVPEEIRKQAEGHPPPPTGPITSIVTDLSDKFKMTSKGVTAEGS